jgi:hypothetical protein
MPMTNPLPGRGQIIQTVRHLMTRPDGSDGRPLNTIQPVLVLEGGPGSGKTVLLDHLRQRVRGIPNAFLGSNESPPPHP